MRPYRQGDHICVVYDTKDEQLSVAALYAVEGFSRGERRFYMVDSKGGNVTLDSTESTLASSPFSPD